MRVSGRHQLQVVLYGALFHRHEVRRRYEGQLIQLITSQKKLRVLYNMGTLLHFGLSTVEILDRLHRRTAHTGCSDVAESMDTIAMLCV